MTIQRLFATPAPNNSVLPLLKPTVPLQPRPDLYLVPQSDAPLDPFSKSPFRFSPQWIPIAWVLGIILGPGDTYRPQENPEPTPIPTGDDRPPPEDDVDDYFRAQLKRKRVQMELAAQEADKIRRRGNEPEGLIFHDTPVPLPTDPADPIFKSLRIYNSAGGEVPNLLTAEADPKAEDIDPGPHTGSDKRQIMFGGLIGDIHSGSSSPQNYPAPFDQIPLPEGTRKSFIQTETADGKPVRIDLDTTDFSRGTTLIVEVLSPEIAAEIVHNLAIIFGDNNLAAESAKVVMDMIQEKAGSPLGNTLSIGKISMIVEVGPSVPEPSFRLRFPPPLEVSWGRIMTSIPMEPNYERRFWERTGTDVASIRRVLEEVIPAQTQAPHIRHPQPTNPPIFMSSLEGGRAYAKVFWYINFDNKIAQVMIKFYTGSFWRSKDPIVTAVGRPTLVNGSNVLQWRVAAPTASPTDFAFQNALKTYLISLFDLPMNMESVSQVNSGVRPNPLNREKSIEGRRGPKWLHFPW